MIEINYFEIAGVDMNKIVMIIDFFPEENLTRNFTKDSIGLSFFSAVNLSMKGFVDFGRRIRKRDAIFSWVRSFDFKKEMKVHFCKRLREI